MKATHTVFPHDFDSTDSEKQTKFCISSRSADRRLASLPFLILGYTAWHLHTWAWYRKALVNLNYKIQIKTSSNNLALCRFENDVVCDILP